MPNRNTRSQLATPFVIVDAARCSACGRCAAVCKSGVLEVRARNDRHVRVVRPRRCTGCHACVAACKEGALDRLDHED